MPKRFEHLSELLDELALHYRLEGKDHVAHQYTKASSELLKADFLPPNPKNIPHIGDAIRDDIAAYRAYGSIPRLEEMRERRPYLSTFCQIKSVGPQTATKIYEETGAETIEELKTVADEGELEEVSGIGPKTAETIRRSLGQL